MAKRNKKRYQVRERDDVLLTTSGRCFLEYVDEEALEAPGKGDFKFFPSVEALQTIYQGDYTRMGYAGYFRVDVWDGRSWCPVILTTLFEGHEHHFSKTERPLDTYALCKERVEARGVLTLRRTYREHWEVVEDEIHQA